MNWVRIRWDTIHATRDREKKQFVSVTLSQFIMNAEVDCWAALTFAHFLCIIILLVQLYRFAIDITFNGITPSK